MISQINRWLRILRGVTELPSGPVGRREDIEARIMQRVRVDEVSGCWLWQGPTSGGGRGGGYARMSLDGQTVAVHIVMWVNRNGYVPGKKQIDHTCRRRNCVNPDHLEMVTHRQNQRRRDMAALVRDPVERAMQ